MIEDFKEPLIEVIKGIWAFGANKVCKAQWAYVR